MVEQATKKCVKCHQHLPLNAYNKNSKRADGKQTYCKNCQKATYQAANTVPKQAAAGKSLAEKHPHLLAEWDYQKNNVSPTFISAGTNYPVWWLCGEGHSYQIPIQQRTRKTRPLTCPQCHKNKAATPQPINPDDPTGLSNTYPHITQWWSDTNTVALNTVKINSNYNATWVCPEGHLFNGVVKNFKFVCPHCELKPVSSYPKLMQQWDYDKNVLNPQQTSYNSAKTAAWKCERGHTWETRIYQRVNSNSECPQCSNNGTSKAESDLAAHVINNIRGSEEIVLRDRTILKNKELDIYLPDLNIAIEYNGLYWHSENRVGRKTHYQKWLQCYQQNIQLITIWEDDWLYNRTLVGNMLRYKLGCYDDTKIFARKTTVTPINYKTAATFLNQYHIQGELQGTTYLALIDSNNSVVAVSVWTRRGSILYLDRYATSVQVVGGMSKLLKHAKNMYVDSVTQIVTFANHEVSDGGLYQKLGFTLEKQLKPDYMYVINGRRTHKFNYRISRFRADPNLKYVPGYTETQLAQLNNLDRVWDCGKSRYIINL